MKKITLTNSEVEAIDYAADFLILLGGHSNDRAVEYATVLKELIKYHLNGV